jgi:hypothetical protein
MNNFGAWFVGVFLQWAACVAAALPFVGIAAWQAKGRTQWNVLGWVAGFFLIALAFVRLDKLVTIIPSPWQGMIFEAAFALIVILATRSATRSGLTLRIDAKAWRAGLMATGLALVFVIVRSAGLRLIGRGEAGMVPGLEFLLYELTMPGIAEELVYRGVIQTRLNSIFARPWKVFGASLGWSWIITAVLFWAIHAFRVDGASISFYWPTLTLQLIVGLILGWMRERSGSLLPPIIAHNLVNIVRGLF